MNFQNEDGKLQKRKYWYPSLALQEVELRDNDIQFYTLTNEKLTQIKLGQPKKGVNMQRTN